MVAGAPYEVATQELWFEQSRARRRWRTERPYSIDVVPMGGLHLAQ